jgi:hypothetical protein
MVPDEGGVAAAPVFVVWKRCRAVASVACRATGQRTKLRLAAADRCGGTGDGCHSIRVIGQRCQCRKIGLFLRR